jgi:hypothetical protein
LGQCYFGDFPDGLDGLHAQFDLLETLGGEAELFLEKQGGERLQSVYEHQLIIIFYLNKSA